MGLFSVFRLCDINCKYTDFTQNAQAMTVFSWMEHKFLDLRRKPPRIKKAATITAARHITLFLILLSIC